MQELANIFIKSIFIDSMKDLIPNEVWSRRKTGFEMPFTRWMNGRMNEKFAKVIKTNKAPKIFKADCKIDWQNNGKIILQKILGLSPYPSAWTNLMGDQNKMFKIYDASIEFTNHNLKIGDVELDKTQFKVAVKDGFIYLKEVQLSGKKRMKIDEFLRGFQQKENCFVK